MLIEIMTKNGTLVDMQEVDGDIVPRVGEEITLPEPSAQLQGSDRLMVQEVIHQMDDGLMVAVVRCRPTRGAPEDVAAMRLELLEELGWLRRE